MNEIHSELLRDSLDNMGKAILRLKEGLLESSGKDSGSLLIDGTIQRFEICTDQMWKLFLRALREEKFDVEPSPKKVMQKAYSLEWIDNEKLWIDMLNDRNATSHIYDEKLAKEIHDRIKIYHEQMEEALNKLVQKFKL